jgi:holo-[acyl-carrier protein] synthase
MIYAIGHDIVENSRVGYLLETYQERALSHLLSKQEQLIYAQRKDKIRFVAKRFAAKEAFAKACGTGLRAPIVLTAISVLNDELGRPYFSFSRTIEDWLSQRGIQRWHLSLSDEKTLSSAVVILEV